MKIAKHGLNKYVSKKNDKNNFLFLRCDDFKVKIQNLLFIDL